MEVEVPHHAADPMSRRVGVLVSVVGILLSVVTIASHRAHTQAVIERTKVNDDWSYYQAKKIRSNVYEVAATLLAELSSDAARSTGPIQKLNAARDKEIKDAASLQDEAHDQERQSDLEEERALRYDIGEGLLELGLVLCSLYFLARNTFFPIAGIVVSLAGIALGVVGYLLH